MPAATLTPHEELVDFIKSRQSENEFNYGILTADRYVKTISECIGSDACYKFMAKGNVSFADILEKSAKSLTYNNPEMIVKDVYNDLNSISIQGIELELPKNTLMVFRHILTTPRKDRDGDVLRTQGAKPDPKMLLLWQHVHTLPIGKMLAVAEHNNKTLEVISAIVDMNELSHDSAVMVDNGMGRFSHGFKAIEFTSMKEEQGKVTKPGGFDVKVFEILEESLVSVPSNVDAETQEVIVSLVEGGKMTSGVMKNIGRELRSKMPKTVNVPIDIKLTLNGKELPNAIQSGTGETKAGATKQKACGCGGASKETDADGAGAKEQETQNKEVDQANADAANDMGSQICPECGITASDDGKCPQCGKALKKNYEDSKAGRVLSSKNYKLLEEVASDLDEIEKGVGMWSAKNSCRTCKDKILQVLKSAGMEAAEASTPEVTVKDAMKKIVLEATAEEQANLVKSLQALIEINAQKKLTDSYRKTVRKN